MLLSDMMFENKGRIIMTG